jgi:hypothetical protein
MDVHVIHPQGYKREVNIENMRQYVFPLCEKSGFILPIHITDIFNRQDVDL